MLTLLRIELLKLLIVISLSNIILEPVLVI
nr:MAG TPA: hypothetical protein [Bacteriophage sp.]